MGVTQGAGEGDAKLAVLVQSRNKIQSAVVEEIEMSAMRRILAVIADPNIADVTIVNARAVLVNGKASGATTLVMTGKFW